MVAVNPNINLVQYAQNYSFIVGRPQGLPTELVQFILAQPNQETTVQVVSLTSIVPSQSKAFALTIFDVVVNNVKHSVMLPIGAYLSDGYATVSIGYIDPEKTKPVLRLVNITKNSAILPASSITDEMVATAIGVPKLKAYEKA